MSLCERCVHVSICLCLEYVIGNDVDMVSGVTTGIVRLCRGV